MLMLLAASQFSACNNTSAQVSAMSVAEREFEANREAILTVRDYFASLEFNSLSYHSLWEEEGIFVFGGNSKYIPIEDESARLAMDLLIASGYISKTKRNGLISFMRWRDGVILSGMVYSTDRHHPHRGIIEHLINVEPMSEDGWFYFEADNSGIIWLPVQAFDHLRMDFEENREAIFAVRDYFIGLEPDWLSFPIDYRMFIDGGRGVMFAGGRGRARVIDIDDLEMEETLEFLLRQGYIRIEKMDGFVFFRRWGSERVGIGVVYSTNGSRPDSSIIPHLVEVERLEGEDGWFFFRASYYRR